MLREEMKIREDKIDVHEAANIELNKIHRRAKQIWRLSKIPVLKNKEDRLRS